MGFFRNNSSDEEVTICSYESGLRCDRGSSSSSRLEDNITGRILHYHWSHGRHRDFTGNDVVTWRGGYTKVVLCSRGGKIIHLIVEDNTGPATTNFRSKTEILRRYNFIKFRIKTSENGGIYNLQKI